MREEGTQMGFKEKGDKLYEDIYDVVRRKSAISRRISEFKKKVSGGTLTADQQNAAKNALEKEAKL